MVPTSIKKALIVGKTTDNKRAYEIPLLKGSVIVADQVYNDFSLLNPWDSTEVFFVIRHKNNSKFTPIKEKELPKNRHPHTYSKMKLLN